MGKSENNNIRNNDCDHLVKNHDYDNILGMLVILGRQLELSMEESREDFYKIKNFFLDYLSEEACDTEEVARRKEVFMAMQYFDRKCQRISHVSESLGRLADTVNNESWGDLDIDLPKEVHKTCAFFSELQVDELYALIPGDIDQSCQSTDDSDDLKPASGIEFF